MIAPNSLPWKPAMRILLIHTTGQEAAVHH